MVGRKESKETLMGAGRILRVNSYIQKELARIIGEEIEMPEGSLVTVTGVETAADLKQAKVWVSVWPEEKVSEVFKILSAEAINLQRQLNKRMRTKSVPNLIFKFDLGQEATEKINRIIEGD